MNSFETVFEWLLAATLRASVLTVVILGLQVVLRRWLPPVWRYALWLPMLAVLVLPALFEAPYALLPQTAGSPPPAPAVVAHAVSAEKFTAFSAPIVTAVPEISAAGALPISAEKVTLPVVPALTIEPPVTSTLPVLAIAWLVGTCGLLVMGFIGYGGALLKLQCVAPSRALSLGFIGIFGQGSEIKSRIREISTYRRSRHARHLAGGTIVTLLMVLGVTKGQQTTPSDSAGAAEDKSSSAPQKRELISKLENPALQALENQLLGNWICKSDTGWTGGYTFKENGAMEGLDKWSMGDSGDHFDIFRKRERRVDEYKLPIQNGKIVGTSAEGIKLTLTKSDLPTFEFQLLGTWGCQTDDQWTGVYTFKENGVMEGDYSWARDENILSVLRAKDGKLNKYELPIKDGTLVGKSAEGKKLILTKTQSEAQWLDYQILGAWNDISDKGQNEVRTFKEEGAMEGGVKWFIGNNSLMVVKEKNVPGGFEEYQFPLQNGKLIGKNDLGQTVTLTR